MSGRLVFLLEELSMRELLEGLLPRIFPSVPFICVPHQGKDDLQKSIPRKLRGWRVPGDRFVIVRDNDGADCVDLKARLVSVCVTEHRPETLVRLVCQELESWYIGDLQALSEAYPKIRIDTEGNRRRFRDPDLVLKPSKELERLVGSFQKLDGARRMAQVLTIGRNASRSFGAFIDGVGRVATEMGY